MLWWEFSKCWPSKMRDLTTHDMLLKMVLWLILEVAAALTSFLKTCIYTHFFQIQYLLFTILWSQNIKPYLWVIYIPSFSHPLIQTPCCILDGFSTISIIGKLGQKSHFLSTFDTLQIFILNLPCSVNAQKCSSNVPKYWHFWYLLQYFLDWKMPQSGAQQETDGSHK